MPQPADTSIDVIIPVHAPVPWLTEALRSLAAQTLRPAWITVVDDGLESRATVRDLGIQLFGAQFQLLENPGRGISAALNAGVEQSNARWIARMDADDVAHPDRLKNQLAFLTTSPDDILGCGTQVRFISADGRSLGRSRLPTSWRDISEQIRFRTSFVHSSLVIRRDALVATPYRPMMDGAEDVDLILRLSESGKILNLGEPLLDYRLHLAQESFHSRARHTAVQELAFRLALCRRQKGSDPLDSDPELAEKFIRWRLATPGYIGSRTFLTALRYMKSHLNGVDLLGAARCVTVALKSLPISPSSLRITWRVFRKAGAALLDESTPFGLLNLT